MERTTLTERLRRVEAEIAAGRPEQALAACQELQTAYPRALRVQRTLGQIYLALRKPREALATLDRALAGDPEDVRACCARALVHQMHGDDVAALAWYRRACDLRPDDQALRATYRDLARRLGEPPYRPSRAGLARLYLRGDLFAHAIREWEQLVAESPDRLDAQVGLAETLWLAGHTAAAEDRCRRILANAPSCVKAMLIQMALALSDGDMDAARAHLERTLQLDPDMAIAQMTFSDALASGDPVMMALLRGRAGAEATEGAATSRPTAGFAQSGPLAGQRNLSRPLVTSAPQSGHTGNTGGPGAPLHPTSPLPPPPRPDVPIPSQPTEVTRAFRETAFMIWDQDDDSQPRIAAQQPGHSDASRDGEQAPSALRALSTMNDDEERRRALNWYTWLQSQGAVALRSGTAGPPPGLPPTQAPGNPPVSRPSVTDLGAPPAGPANGAAPPIPPAPPAPPVLPAPTDTATHFVVAAQDGEPETAPLPTPSPEALRTMFAELGGNTASQAIVDSGTALPLDTMGTMETADNASSADAASGADDLSAALWPPAPLAPDESAYDADANMREDDAAVAHARGIVDADTEAPQALQEPEEPEESPAPQTLEDLERQFAASGFTPVAARHGMLAEMEREQPPEQPSSDEPEPALSEAPATSSAKPAATSGETTPSGPDPRDYPARLAHARQRRDDGQLDDALNEYRVIIKNAPDLLSEVLSDLRASLEELPEHPNLHSVLGDALVCQGDYEGALEEYNRATALAQARSGQS